MENRGPFISRFGLANQGIHNDGDRRANKRQFGAGAAVRQSAPLKILAGIFSSLSIARSAIQPEAPNHRIVGFGCLQPSGP